MNYNLNCGSRTNQKHYTGFGRICQQTSIMNDSSLEISGRWIESNPPAIRTHLENTTEVQSISKDSSGLDSRQHSKVHQDYSTSILPVFRLYLKHAPFERESLFYFRFVSALIYKFVYISNKVHTYAYSTCLSYTSLMCY